MISTSNVSFSYPSAYIESQFHKYFAEHHTPSSFMPALNGDKHFFLMRRGILSRPTRRQSQVASNVALANLDNDQTDETAVVTSQATTHPAPVQNRLLVHYTHEKRFRPFKREMHRIYESIFHNTPAMQVKLMVGNRNRRDGRHELIHKRPKRSLLQNVRIKKKYLKLLRKWVSSTTHRFTIHCLERRKSPKTTSVARLTAAQLQRPR